MYIEGKNAIRQALESKITINKIPIHDKSIIIIAFNSFPILKRKIDKTIKAIIFNTIVPILLLK